MSETTMANKRIDWVREEMVLLVVEYFRTKKLSNSEQTKSKVLLSNKLRQMGIDRGLDIPEDFRNLNGITMQMANIKHLDPEEQERGNKGLDACSELMKTVVGEYLAEPEKIISEAYAIDNRREISKTTDEPEKIINASPTKEFFINMLVRDIELQPAIAELVDNSLDGARKFRAKYGYKGECTIQVFLSGEEFKILDTCGGISVSDARNYCFRFGRDPKRPQEIDNGTGIFGIGMKRALFKMGRAFTVVSKTPTDHFKVEVDVDEWLDKDNPEWTFKFVESEEGEDNPLDKCGTEIRVSRLYQPISASFENPYFENTFREYLKRRSSIFKTLNVSTRVNDKYIESVDISFLFDQKYKPYVKNEVFDGVNIRIIAACARMGEPQKAGWYVLCNNRMIVLADKTEVTGWGEKPIRPYHGDFAAFRGYVFFDSDNLELLPWNTTKTSVDSSSKYYRRAKRMMDDALLTFQKWRTEVNNLVEANEGLTADNVLSGNVKVMSDVEVNRYISSDHEFGLPVLTNENFPLPPEPRTSITFYTEKRKVDEVKKKLGLVAKKDIGETIFNYFYEREIGEDE